MMRGSGNAPPIELGESQCRREDWKGVPVGTMIKATKRVESKRS